MTPFHAARWAPPPETVEVLLARANQIAGHTLAELAGWLGAGVPDDLRRAKGWPGELVEAALGGSAGSRAEPDFPGLGVELKTLPVDPSGAPREATYVCTAPLDGSLGWSWEASWPRRKLARVLWVPIVGLAGEAPGSRRIGSPRLWSPDAEEAAELAADWSELCEALLLGGAVAGFRGRALQLRPKGASAAQVAWAQDSDATWVLANPLGFYLNPAFTKRLLAKG